MIRYLSRKELNEAKYNACIQQALNTRIYAYSWYLDCVADNWGVLVYKDYLAVMPLPWRTKYFVKYIYPPCWTQQLGVFSSEIISENLMQSFLTSIPNVFKKQTIYLNSANRLPQLQNKTNFILPLNKPYQKLLNEYRKTRKRVINTKSKDLLVKTAKYEQVIAMFKENTAGDLGIPESDFIKLENLCAVLLKKQQLKVMATYKKNLLCAAAFFLIDNKRIVYLFSTTNKIGKALNAMSIIIDSVIKKHENSSCILDFEGSEVKGIAFFFKSFGAELEPYFLFEKPFSF